MRPLGSLARMGIGAFVASCASAPLGSDTRAQDGLAIAPYGVHDECFDLAVGIDKRDIQLGGQVTADRGFAGTHQTD